MWKTWICKALCDTGLSQYHSRQSTNARCDFCLLRMVSQLSLSYTHGHGKRERDRERSHLHNSKRIKTNLLAFRIRTYRVVLLYTIQRFVMTMKYRLARMREGDEYARLCGKNMNFSRLMQVARSILNNDRTWRRWSVFEIETKLHRAQSAATLKWNLFADAAMKCTCNPYFSVPFLRFEWNRLIYSLHTNETLKCG